MARNGRTLIRRLIVRRISIYALDFSQGLFIVLEAYNSGLKWIMYIFLLNKTSNSKPTVQFLPFSVSYFFICFKSILSLQELSNPHADIIIFL